MIRSSATINGYTKDDIMEAYNNLEIRKKWDKSYENFQLIEKNEIEGYEIIQCCIKVFNL